MKTIVRLSIVALLFALCAINRASAQTVSGSGVLYNAAARAVTQYTPQLLQTNAASFAANASMVNGAGSGTFVVDFATQTYSGFVTNVAISAPNSKGVIVATVASEGYLTVNATKAQTIVNATATFIVAPGSKGGLSFTMNNYKTGAQLGGANYNLITGGIGMVQ